MARNVSGGSNYLAVPSDLAPVDITGTQISVFCWFKPNTIDGTDQVLISKSQYVASDVQYNLGHQNGKVWFEIGGSGSTDITSSPYTNDVKVGHWSAALGILDGTFLQAWCDGKRGGATIARSIQNTGFQVGIGVRSGAGGGEHNGPIAHAAIWATALKPDEAYRLTVLGHSPLTVRNEMLRAYWPLSGTIYPNDQDYAKTNSVGQIGTCTVLPGPWLPNEGVPLLSPETQVRGAMLQLLGLSA